MNCYLLCSQLVYITQGRVTVPSRTHLSRAHQYLDSDKLIGARDNPHEYKTAAVPTSTRPTSRDVTVTMATRSPTAGHFLPGLLPW